MPDNFRNFTIKSIETYETSTDILYQGELVSKEILELSYFFIIPSNIFSSESDEKSLNFNVEEPEFKAKNIY